jgi:hypothetical protein
MTPLVCTSTCPPFCHVLSAFSESLNDKLLSFVDFIINLAPNGNIHNSLLGQPISNAFTTVTVSLFLCNHPDTQGLLAIKKLTK